MGLLLRAFRKAAGVSRNRAAAKGVWSIQLLGLMVISLMFSAIAIDFAYYFAAQNQLQSATDASTLAATDQLYRSDAPDPADRRSDARSSAKDYISRNLPALTLDPGDVTFGFVDPKTKKYDPDTYKTISNDPAYALTAGYNSVRVRLKRTADATNGPLGTVMAKMLGKNTMETGAFSVALLDRGIASVSSGLRPIYACQAQVDTALKDGVAENNAIRVYGDHMEVDGVGNIAGCPKPGSGNWGFADLRNCDPDAPGANNTADWFDSGFPGTVYSNQCYSTQSGNFLVNNGVENALDKLIANKTVITIPVYNTYSGGGSNTNVGVSGFVGFVITGYRSNGSASGRYIDGYFTKTVCRNECTTSNDGSGTGGLMVKIRLASQS